MNQELDLAMSRPRTFRRPNRSDGRAMWALAQGAVDQNSPYAYLLFGEYFGDASLVVEQEGEVVGFIAGFRRPDRPDTQFVWQIVVGSNARGEGLGAKMLDVLVERPHVERVRCLEATVTPTNAASKRLFRSFAKRRDARCEESLLFAANDFPNESDHEAEIRFRIGPW